MSNNLPMEQTIKRLQMQLNWLRLFIIVLIAIIAIILYIYFKRDSIGSNFDRKVHNDTAFSHIDMYRGRWSAYTQTKIVWYDSNALRKYVNETFKNLVDNFDSLRISKDKRSWVVGFYFMRKDKSATERVPRLDFYVVPTIYDSSLKRPLDFADPIDWQEYLKYRKILTKGGDGDSLASNTGHIWP